MSFLTVFFLYQPPSPSRVPPCFYSHRLRSSQAIPLHHLLTPLCSQYSFTKGASKKPEQIEFLKTAYFSIFYGAPRVSPWRLHFKFLAYPLEKFPSIFPQPFFHKYSFPVLRTQYQMIFAFPDRVGSFIHTHILPFFRQPFKEEGQRPFPLFSPSTMICTPVLKHGELNHGFLRTCMCMALAVPSSANFT